jgi:aconitate hydratase
MITLFKGGAFLADGKLYEENETGRIKAETGMTAGREEARKETITWKILQSHNVSGDEKKLKIRFDALASHDITFVGIIQTAKASGMQKFPLPYVLTNCHNSLCAVGGTINEDDHVFGLTAARHYGGIYVPPHLAVIHQYMREMHAGCGKMILGSDSHTRYGALGTLAVGEGGGELVKQLLKDTYDITYPETVAVYLEGCPKPGVGPQDIALSIIGAVFKNGYVKNKILEFVGPGISSMSCDFRNGIDVMTTETTALSSVWCTDAKTEKYLAVHGRKEDYRELKPGKLSYYDGAIVVDLNTVKPMIALPFHPSNVFSIDELNENAGDILRTVEQEAEKKFGSRGLKLCLTDKIRNGRLVADQAVIAGCAGGTYSNLAMASHILKGKNCGNGLFNLSVYPSSQPVYLDLVKKGMAADLMEAGAVLKTAFCGPCFGAGETPANGALSIRHSTRNFPNREGSKPGNGQLSAVALMDARSIAATAANGGVLTSAEGMGTDYRIPDYEFDGSVYAHRVYNGFRKENPEEAVIYGPNIKDWPAMPRLSEHILLRVCSKIMDEVTTTDELIPSGETSSYRSNPIGLAEFTLSRRDPEYVGRSKKVFLAEKAREEGKDPSSGDPAWKTVFERIRMLDGYAGITPEETEIGSMIYAVKPGDGSAREQAASCQRVLGGLANIAREYATKRYRSNVINWGMIPFQYAGEPGFSTGDFIFVPNARRMFEGDMQKIEAWVIPADPEKKPERTELFIAEMTDEEKEIVKSGCLINYNRAK